MLFIPWGKQCRDWLLVVSSSARCESRPWIAVSGPLADPGSLLPDRLGVLAPGGIGIVSRSEY
jgi:hypothetical protein